MSSAFLVRANEFERYDRNCNCSSMMMNDCDFDSDECSDDGESRCDV